MVYLVYGVTLDSDLPLDLPTDPPEPGTGGVPTPALVLRRLDSDPADGDRTEWSGSDDGPWRTGRNDGDFVLRFDPAGAEARMDFVVSGDGARVWWHASDAGSTTLTHLILDHVLPQAMMRQGHLVLHASCVADPSGRVLAIAGQSGQGKSTLAAALVGRGHRLLSDDCLVVDPGSRPPMVAGAYPGLRLHEASLALAAPPGARSVGPVSDDGTKLRVTLGGGDEWVGRRRFPLAQLVVLAQEPLGHGPVQPIGPAEAVFRLLHHSFHLADLSERAEVFTRLAAVVDVCPVHEVHYEHTGPGLVRTLDQLESLMSPPPPGTGDDQDTSGPAARDR